MRCSFCGREFDPDAAFLSCEGCPLTGHCGLLRCPHCGFDNVPEAQAIRLFRRILARKSGRDKVASLPTAEAQITLADLSPGQSAQVIGLVSENGGRSQALKLVAIGLLPGAEVLLLRRFPSFVFQIGSSDFAVDSDVAKLVVVKPKESDHGSRGHTGS